MSSVLAMRLLQCCILLLGLILVPVSGLACTVCVDLPERTLADRLLNDRIVVIAQPAPDNPFSFTIVETIAGDAQALAELPAIPFLVDAATRRQFKIDNTLTVLMTFGSTEGSLLRSSGIGTWHRLMTMTPQRRQFVDTILKNADAWRRNSTRNEARFAFFAAHHTDPDRAIQVAALTELARVPYAFLRSLRDTLPPQELRRRLSDINEIPFEALYVKLLGISNRQEADAYVSLNFDRAMQRGSSMKTAWILAGIEVGGAGALDRVSQQLLRGALSEADRRELLTALSVTGTARPQLREVIAPVLHEAVQLHPERRADIAYTLYQWQDWTLAPYFEQLLVEEPKLDQVTRSILQLLITSARAEAG